MTEPVGCLYSIGGAGGECPSREKPLETDACVQSTGPQQSRQRWTAGERKTAAFQSPIEFWHPTGLNSKIRLLSHRAYGFASPDALIATIYLCCSNIQIDLPHQ
jgi:hypothetical protein